jgi:hypothetical protein
MDDARALEDASIERGLLPGETSAGRLRLMTRAGDTLTDKLDLFARGLPSSVSSSSSAEPIETYSGLLRGELMAAAADLESANCVFSNVREGFEGVVGIHVSCADSSMALRR